MQVRPQSSCVHKYYCIYMYYVHYTYYTNWVSLRHSGAKFYESQRIKAGAHLFFNAFWLIPHFCINLMYMRDTMHQIDSGVIISFLKAILRKFRECVEIPLGIAGAAAKTLTNRLRRLLGKEKTASGHLMYGAHECLVPVNYATSNVFKQLEEKQKAARHTRACDYRHLLLLQCCCRSFCQTCSVRKWTSTTRITKAIPL